MPRDRASDRAHGQGEPVGAKIGLQGGANLGYDPAIRRSAMCLQRQRYDDALSKPPLGALHSDQPALRRGPTTSPRGADSGVGGPTTSALILEADGVPSMTVHKDEP